jgi:hypothetical protein
MGSLASIVFEILLKVCFCPPARRGFNFPVVVCFSSIRSLKASLNAQETADPRTSGLLLNLMVVDNAQAGTLNRHRDDRLIKTRYHKNGAAAYHL